MPKGHAPTRHMTVCGLIRDLEILRAQGHGGKYVLIEGVNSAGNDEIANVEIREGFSINYRYTSEVRTVCMITRTWGID